MFIDEVDFEYCARCIVNGYKIVKVNNAVLMHNMQDINVKRKFVKVMFFGALALSTVTYVGCKDYDDDIDNLQTQIDANKASIAELQNFVKEGKMGLLL